MTKEEILERSKNLGILDIRFGKGDCSLDDYEIALNTIEKTHETITDDILRQAREAGTSGVVL